jgi:hyperosmotically inducible periplasmic protein
MTRSVCAVVAVLLLLAGVCLAADKGSDDTIYNQVLLRLAGDPVVKGGELKVEVKSGVVTLTGTLEEARQKDRASKVAKKVKGVTQVINNIDVKKSTER